MSVEGQPPRLRRLVDEPGLVMAASGGLVLCVVSGRFHGGMIRSVRDAHLALSSGDAHPARGAVLAVVRERVLRERASFAAGDLPAGREALAELGPLVAAMAIVLEGRGVVPTLARAFASGGALFGASSHPSRVFSDEAEAARWLAPHVPSPGPSSPEAVLSALASLVI